MQLKVWLFEKGMSLKDFAKKVKRNYSYLCKLINHGTPMTMKLATAIEKKTRGEVTVKELFDQYELISSIEKKVKRKLLKKKRRKKNSRKP